MCCLFEECFITLVVGVMGVVRAQALYAVNRAVRSSEYGFFCTNTPPNGQFAFLVFLYRTLFYN